MDDRAGDRNGFERPAAARTDDDVPVMQPGGLPRVGLPETGQDSSPRQALRAASVASAVGASVPSAPETCCVGIGPAVANAAASKRHGRASVNRRGVRGRIRLASSSMDSCRHVIDLQKQIENNRTEHHESYEFHGEFPYGVRLTPRASCC